MPQKCAAAAVATTRTSQVRRPAASPGASGIVMSAAQSSCHLTVATLPLRPSRIRGRRRTSIPLFRRSRYTARRAATRKPYRLKSLSLALECNCPRLRRGPHRACGAPCEAAHLGGIAAGFGAGEEWLEVCLRRRCGCCRGGGLALACALPRRDSRPFAPRRGKRMFAPLRLLPLQRPHGFGAVRALSRALLAGRRHAESPLVGPSCARASRTRTRSLRLCRRSTRRPARLTPRRPRSCATTRTWRRAA